MQQHGCWHIIHNFFHWTCHCKRRWTILFVFIPILLTLYSWQIVPNGNFMSYSIVIPDFTYRASSIFVVSLCTKNPASETKFMKDFGVHHFENFAKLTENLRAPLLKTFLLFLGSQRIFNSNNLCYIWATLGYLNFRTPVVSEVYVSCCNI
jgi:hypothetical protein